MYQEKLIAFDKENKHTSYISGKEINNVHMLMLGYTTNHDHTTKTKANSIAMMQVYIDISLAVL